MKKMFLVLSMMLISTSVYAMGLSIGFSTPGFGLGFLRGDNAEDFVKSLEALGAEESSAFSFAPAIQLDLMIELSSFLAIETGIGYSTSSIVYEGEVGNVRTETTFRRNEMTIPVMLRLQLQLGSLLGYASTGVKFGIPQSKTYESRKVFINDSLSDFLSDTDSDDGSDLSLDVAFAVGGELNILYSHYIGVRVGYDLNVISPLNTDNLPSDYEWYQDNFNVSLTYRYAFGR